MNKRYFCPVCGFEGLKESPYGNGNEPSYEICPCCGFEFGFDSINTEDKEGSYKSYREDWIRSGSKWFLPQKMPKDWELEKQLKILLKLGEDNKL